MVQINYPGYAVPQPTKTTILDVLDQWNKGVADGRQERFEAEAPDAFASYIDSLYGPQSAPGGGAQTTGLVGSSHEAAMAAEDPMLSAYFANTRRSESGGNDAAKNPNSSALGRYQFIDSTWQGLMQSHPELGLTADGRTDPAQQEKAIRAFTADNARHLRGAGVPVNPGALYAAHFLGAGGASKVLGGDPNSPVSAYVDPSVIEANAQLQGMTVGQFSQWAAEKGGNGKGGYAAPLDVSGPGGLPSREIMMSLFRNPVTRPLALDAIKVAQSSTAGKPTDDMQEYMFALSQGFAGSFADWQAQNKSGTTVNVDTAGNSGAFGKKADELAAGRMDETVAGGAKAQEMMADLEALRNIGASLETGKTAEVLNALGPYAEAAGIDISGLGEGQAYDAIISRMAPQMRTPGAGASSDFDAKQFLKSLPGLGKSPEGNALIIATFQAIQDHKVKAAEIASQALSGEIKWQEADRQIRALPNPFKAFKDSQKGAPKTDAAGDAPPADWTGDAALWQFLTPEERALWQN
ncbi:hypothetical protein PRN20_18240 [Devosia sp. ZB163]|uniref:hypothetical protein n=1 Tax=Devosia sp. ZB163 TaxID=3025938 RepID=UPI0023615774|nr:hypothetical protein [Devosia sp. ZB163]MDC9825678.1 hypothetical protein [Devosia sp. ZB163]